MIPSALITHLEEGMEDFLRASFWSSTPAFEGLLERFLEERESLFKGPYVSMQLPFRLGTGQVRFERMPLKYPPYEHQEKAFRRIKDGQNTIVATGTGSGKTECFAVPLLAHCAEHLSERGIKAIILYPMNALAQDQAERLAELVWENEALRGNMNIGMYVGGSGASAHTTMGARHVITDRKTLRENPPDILLTNYKMLDYLLLRPEDQVLWQDNGPETLKYLIVDELHTFDGAQGTDLACLIRRLRARLKTPKGHLTCVGTSATLSTNPNASKALLDYAGQVFGESFDDGAVVGESRLDAGDFFGATLIDYQTDIVPELKALDPQSYADEDAYIKAQMEIWFGRELERADLGEALKGNIPLRNLVTLFDKHGLYSVDDLAAELFRKSDSTLELKRLRTLSLLALVSHARQPNGLPLAQIRIQLWQRELRRMVASVNAQPALAFYDDLQLKDRERHLPVVYCRDCGLMGWVTLVLQERKSHLASDLRDLYNAYFAADPRVEFIFLEDETSREPFLVPSQKFWLHSASLVRQSPEPDHKEGYVKILVPDTNTMENGRLKLCKDCPQCSAEGALSLVGYQAASLTSTFISQLFSTPFNNDRRLLTFSDSVQDAAHRAGFFGARTWSFNVRVAIQHVLNQGGNGKSLGELCQLVPKYWRKTLGDVAFVGTFIPPNLEWMNEYEELKVKSELKGEYLVGLVERRLSWEVYQEFTFRSMYGRTLQRSGAAALAIDSERFKAALGLVKQNLREELAINLSDQKAAHILMGFVERMRSKGAVFYPALPKDYISSGGKNTFVFGRKFAMYLPNVGPATRLPAFWTTQSGTARFENATGQGANSWAPRWVTRVLGDEHVLQSTFSKEATEIVLQAMVQAELADEVNDGLRVWGLRLDALKTTTELKEVRTSKARVRQWVAQDEADIWEKMPALTQPLGGHWERVENGIAPGTGYYAKLYQSGGVTRVNAAEHTGLLKREDREDVEFSFKSEPQRPWDINLLSCTPTLEMGIDIGLLSSAILCSVPPGVANYIQRVGRAGRKDGNSLVLTIANGNSHDLYFFSNPDEMLRGDVEPPGVFLNASAVLARQLTAYCLDKWISTKDITRKDFPRKLHESFVGLKDPSRTDKFPYNFIDYMASNQTMLLKGFFDLFSDITQETRDAITNFMRGKAGEEGSLEWQLINRLEMIKRERDNRTADQKTLSSRIQKLEALPTRSPAEEEEVMELRQERRAHERLLQSLNERDLLAFLTDEGLIPNYAFPEAGVSLKSIIWKQTKESEDEEGRRYQNLEFAYERPARSAIVELAPNAHFYAGGRRVRVNQVDIKRTAPETWIFCPTCTYAAIATSSVIKECPNCGKTGIGDAGQKRTMLKLSQVFAWTKDADSRIDDERDEREANFFNRQMLVYFPGDMKSTAFHLDVDEVPFGAEFVSSVTFREINFGHIKADGTKFRIAGTEAVRDGFKICNSCGMVQGHKAQHAPSCKFRNQPDAAKYETALYLYREFRSEAVRLLLPFLDSPGRNQKLHSFVAALELGLRKYFGGKIDHLESTIHSEPLEDTESRKQFLVLYDTVPGGTGYLKELIRDKEAIFNILEKAMATMRSCTCAEDETKDGCYRCVYAYRHARDMADTSRRSAMEEIGRILRHRETWRPIKTLGMVNVSSLIDSVLEARFIEAVDRHVTRQNGTFTPTLHEGKTAYTLHLGDAAWRLELQVPIGPANGVVQMCKADFVFRPLREDGSKPIVVFTDGFRFHANRLEKDLAQRMALLWSERFWVWSLTWEDVMSELDQTLSAVMDPLQVPQMDHSFMNETFKQLNGGTWDFGRSSFAQLFHLLRTKDLGGFKTAACIHLMGRAAASMVPSETWHAEVSSVAPPNVANALHQAVLPHWRHAQVEIPDAEQRSTGQAVDMRIFMAFGRSLPAGDPRESALVLWLDDTPQRLESPDFKEQWRALWSVLNRLQFLSSVVLLSSERQADVEFAPILNQMTIPAGAEPLFEAPQKFESEWDDLMELVDPDTTETVRAWRQFGFTPPVCGWELLVGGRVKGVAEFVWESKKVAVLFQDQVASRPAFESAGWRVFDFDDLSAEELGHLVMRQENEQ